MRKGKKKRIDELSSISKMIFIRIFQPLQPIVFQYIGTYRKHQGPDEKAKQQDREPKWDICHISGKF